MTTGGTGRAVVVGTGLIGGSIGMGLRKAGWFVSAVDTCPGVQQLAVECGAADRSGFDDEADLGVVATPLGQVPGVARHLLARLGPNATVTDVAGVKGPVLEAVTAPNFVGGHPMAGSEQEGLDGADPDMFQGATWVLTPTQVTDPAAFVRTSEVAASLGAEVVALEPEHHDALVAVVSHVPHLVAATMMSEASEASEQHAALLRLAAGGFRDMTRVAAGHPGIWPDICAQNRSAIVSSLDSLVAALLRVRHVVDSGRTDQLEQMLSRARAARRNLPGQAPSPERLAELRVIVPDRPGVFAQLTTLAGELGVNLFDMEVAHSAEGPQGVVILVVSDDQAPVLRQAISGLGMRSSQRRLG